MTITRLIRQHEGDAVLANLRPETAKLLDEMRMDSYWEMFKDVEEAKSYFDRSSG